jgi:hypothetical protein
MGLSVDNLVASASTPETLPLPFNRPFSCLCLSVNNLSLLASASIPEKPHMNGKAELSN